AWLVWGIALTESRTAMLTLALATAAVTLMRPSCLSQKEVRAVQGVLGVYLLLLAAKPVLASALGLHMPLTLLERSAGELRWSLWQMSLEASLESPWWGYGVGRSNAGYFEVFEGYQHKLGNTYFEQSHNLILDLALWAGWPLALLLCVCAGVWLFRTARGIRSAEALIVLSALLVFLVHAMLEFPLHYGYFLWPFFALAGALSGQAQRGGRGLFRVHWAAVLALLISLGSLLVVIAQDYLKIEQAFTELRFQVARVGTGHDETPPQTLLLTDWPDAIALSRSMPKAGMSAREIAHWEALMLYNTSPLALRKVIGAHRLNGHEAEAQAWAIRACWLLSEKACRGLLDEWPRPSTSAPPSGTPSGQAR
ncbi:PglL family O-oligosaccharyltransferase, partial [Acidovorax lacteus]|uniref:PglL family O-oligosaccharyltransferase n=1 Tax=Acidovorax lacteus TaxID=1924988 RepID=UPI0031EFE42C